MPKFVFSRTLTLADWNTTVIYDVVPEHIAELKAQPGGDIALSGANLASAVMRQGLVDEFRILVHPVVLGHGRPLFEDPDVRLSLRLEGTGRSATALFCSTTRDYP
jgi:dihydrofolate reductase